MEKYTNFAKNKKLYLTPEIVGFSEQDFIGKCLTTALKEFYLPLVVNAPVNYTPWFIDVETLNINSDKEDEIIKSLIESLGISDQNVFAFEHFTSNQESVRDVNLDIEQCEGRKFIYRVSSTMNAMTGIFKGIRNALAHGGFGYKNGLFVLYSVRQEKTSYLQRKINFYLELENISQLTAFVEAQEKISALINQ